MAFNLPCLRWVAGFLLIVCHVVNTVRGGTAAVMEEPRFVEPMQNVTVTAGRHVKLTCVVENLGTYKIAWIAYDKSAILTVQEHVITRNPRINVTFDGYRTWTLHIQNVNASDAGTYMCQVNTIVARSQFGVIQVVVPPNIVDSESSGDVMVQEGANVTLMCSATGSPTPTITWRREDSKKININRTHSEVEYVGSKLQLSKISRTDMAAYLCIARNGVPPIMSKRMQVHVDFPPMMTIPHQLVGAPLGYSIALECSIEAHPQPLTYWTKGGVVDSAMIHKSNKYHIEDIPGKESYRTNMKLTIRKLEEEDIGTYKCVAKNSRGETESSIKLNKSDPPTTTSSTPPSYYDKIFKDTRKKVSSGKYDNYIGEGRETFEIEGEDSNSYPYYHKPREPERFGGDVYGREEDMEGKRRYNSVKETSRVSTENDNKHRKNNQRDTGHFTLDFFNSAPGMESSTYLPLIVLFLLW